MIFNPKIECMEREEMRALQSERLKKVVKACYEKVPFYKKKMDSRGITPDDIKTIDDIVKLPFTTKTDLRDEYPFGLQAVSQDKVVRMPRAAQRANRWSTHTQRTTSICGPKVWLA